MKCNMDCFNCPYNDCKIDGIISIEEMKDLTNDHIVSKDYKKVKRYLQSEKGKAWLKQYHQTEKYKEYHKKWDKSEKRVAYKKVYMKAYNDTPQRKAYLDRTREQRNAYQRAYRLRKKLEKEAI